MSNVSHVGRVILASSLCAPLPGLEASRARSQVPDPAISWPEGCQSTCIWFADATIWIDDVDGDGERDLLIPDAHCWWREESTELGLVRRSGGLFVVSGTDGSLLNYVEPPTAALYFGSGLAEVGDVAGDSKREVLVFSYSMDRGGRKSQEQATSHGQLHCLSPGTGELHAVSQGLPAHGWAGKLAPAGDFDGDGAQDVLSIGGTWSGGLRESVWTGHYAWLSSRTLEVLHSVELPLRRECDLRDILGLPDVNGDGVPDVAVASRAPGDGPDGTWGIDILSGRDAELLRRIRDPGQGGDYGESLAVGDMDGDGALELVVGSRGMEPGSLSAVYIHELSSGRLLRTLEVPEDLGKPLCRPGFGASVALLEGAAERPGLLVIAEEDGGFGALVCGYDPRSSRVAWTAKGPEYGKQAHYGVIMQLDPHPCAPGQPMLAVGTANGALGADHIIEVLDPRSGQPRFFVSRSGLYRELLRSREE